MFDTGAETMISFMSFTIIVACWSNWFTLVISDKATLLNESTFGCSKKDRSEWSNFLPIGTDEWAAETLDDDGSNGDIRDFPNLLMVIWAPCWAADWGGSVGWTSNGHRRAESIFWISTCDVSWWLGSTRTTEPSSCIFWWTLLLLTLFHWDWAYSTAAE